MPPEIRTINVQYAVRVDLTVEVDDEGNSTIIDVSTPYIGDNEPGEDAFDTLNDERWRHSTEAEWLAGQKVLNDLGVRNDY